MTLHAVAMPGEQTKPWLVFLHGFSGDSREWQAVGERLTGHPRLYVDLPGHGKSATIKAAGFADVCDLLRNTLMRHNILTFWLVGYSLGGRVAMNWASQSDIGGMQGIIIEGGHPGLPDESTREQRLQADKQWASRLCHQPLAQVFDDWYQQPVFADLSAQQRQALVAVRQHNNGPALASMLLATSLGVQPDLRSALSARRYPFHYLCGARDSKFRAIALALDAPCHLITHAGHNAHRENPAAVADCLAQILRF